MSRGGNNQKKAQREMKEHNCGKKGQSHEIGKKYFFLKKGHRYCTRRQIGKVQYALASKKAQMLNGKAILRQKRAKMKGQGAVASRQRHKTEIKRQINEVERYICDKKQNIS